MRNTIVIAILLAGAVWIGIATHPRPAAADDEKPPQSVMHVYDLRDYLLEIRDYPLNPPTSPTTQPASPGASAASYLFTGPPAPSGSPRERLDEVLKLVADTIQPDSWRDAGGSVGDIRELDGKIYVTQTPGAQAQLKALLAEITGDANRTVRVRAAWLLLSDDELAVLRQPAKPGQPDADAPLSDAAFAKAKPIAHAELLCLNGQTVHIATGTAGISFKVRPILTASGKEAIVDVLNVVGDSAPPAPTTEPAGAGFGQRLHTTARIPIGENIIIGGITAERAGKDPPKQLYLVMRVDAGQ